MTNLKNDLNANRSDDIKLNNSSNDDDFFDTTNEGQAVELKNKRKETSQKKDGESKSYKKQTFLKQLRTLAILVFLGIFTGCGLGVWYFNTELRINVDYNIDPTPYLYNINSIMSQTLNISNASEFSNFVSIAHSQGKKPTDFTPAQNFALAEYHAQQANTWTAIGEGKISTIVQQSMYSEKKYNGEKATFVNISVSDIVAVAKCFEYYNGENAVNVFNGSNPKSNTATWTETSSQTTDEFKANMGNLPNAIQPYIISDKTIVDGNTKENVVYDNLSGTYSFTIQLDNLTSALYYARQVKATGGLGAYPVFHSIIQTITIDENWNLISIEVKDRYDAIVGIKVECSGYLKTYYTFNNPNIEMPV